MKGFFFFKSVGVPRGSPELGKGNPGWVPSVQVKQKSLSGTHGRHVATHDWMEIQGRWIRWEPMGWRHMATSTLQLDLFWTNRWGGERERKR